MMMKKMRKHILSAAVIAAVIGMQSAVWAAPGDYRPTPEQDAAMRQGYNNAGVQMNQTREYLERQRVARQIQEDRAKQRAQVEGTQTGEKEETSAAVKFKLNKITTDKSDVLTDDDIASVTKEYVGKEITIQDLYKIVSGINEKYAAGGYLTCRAFLAPQTIKNGEVHITLIEGRTGEIVVQGNKSTKAKYIMNRLHLTKDNIDNINDLNKDLLLFNASNDVQLRISMQAGTQPGTTDYAIAAYEPKQHNFTIYGDNAGSDTSGEWRGGLFYNNRSLTGVRDSLNMSTMLSDGTRVFSTSYTRPIGRSGTKLGVNYSTNSVHIIDGDLEDLDVRGHSTAYGVQLIQPLVVTERICTEATLDYSYQNSQTDFMGMHWVDDTSRGYTAAYSVTNYGDSSIIYQRHGYRFGDFENISGEGKNFGKYTFNGFYQKAYAHGQMLSARLDGQWSGNNYLASAEQFYIGGMNSVRGYKESLLGGDHGYAASIEYAVPLDKGRTTNAFIFADYGEVLGDSAFDDHILAGTGFGIRTTLSQKVFLSATLGVPLRRELNGTEVSKTRIHCMLNGQF